MIIKVNYTVSDIYMSTSVSAVYIKVVYSGVSAGGGGTWGTITGTLSAQTDLQSALDNKVPYTGATGAVNLGAYGITAASLIKSGGTSAQFLKADGSVDSSTYTPTSRTLTINGTTQDLTADRTFTIATANIYNADGTLTSARTLTSGGFPLTFTGSNTAASLIARGLNLTHTLVASANGDTLVGLDINPTFTIGAFTGVYRASLRAGATSSPEVTNGEFGSILIQSFAVSNNWFGDNVYFNNATFKYKNNGYGSLVQFFNGQTIFTNFALGTANVVAGSYNSALKIDYDGSVALGGNITTTKNSYSGSKALLTAAGRLLLGTTSESTFLLDVNGTARTGTLTVKGTTGNAKSLEVFNSFNGLSCLVVDQYGIISFTNGGTNTTAAIVGTLFNLGQSSSSATIIWQANSNEISQYTTLGTRNSAADSATVIVSNNQTSTFGFTVAGNMSSGQQNDRVLMNFRHWSGSGVLTFGSINQVQRYTLLDADIVVTPTVANKTLHGIRYRPTISGTALSFHYAATFASGQIGIGTETPNASSLLDITSTTKGFLPPRMTTTQINAIATPAEGLQVYNTTIHHMCFYMNGAWAKINHSPM